jgi:hypothetical protein
MHEIQALSNSSGVLFGAWLLQHVCMYTKQQQLPHLTVPCAARVFQPSLQAALVHVLDAAAAPAGSKSMETAVEVQLQLVGVHKMPHAEVCCTYLQG